MSDDQKFWLMLLAVLIAMLVFFGWAMRGPG